MNCKSILLLGAILLHVGNLLGESTVPTVTSGTLATAIPSDVPDEQETKAHFIVISKQKMQLTVYDFRSRAIATYPIACGKNYGDKRKPGDMKTPEGFFSVQQIQDASSWTHDFKDGKGDIAGAYGPWFVRLLTPPHQGIGIHGTHDESSIGTRVTEGCIRMRNDDLRELVRRFVYPGMPVFIFGSDRDIRATADLAPQH